MNLRRITSSASILGAASVVSLLGLILAAFPISSFLRETSQSVVENFYLMGVLMLLVLLSSAALGFFVIRLVWGPERETAARDGDSADLSEAEEMRGMRVTGTKKILVLIVMLAATTVLADQLGKGVLLTDTRAVRVLTLLRSPKGQDRADAVNDAVMLVGDKRVTDALGRILTTQGEAREWAAYAAGIRKDKSLGDALVNLLRTGTDRERSAAAVASARMGDERLIDAGIAAYGEMKTLKNDILKAFGMLGRRDTMQKRNLEAAGKFLNGLIQSMWLDIKPKQLAMWAAGNFNAPEALSSIERVLQGGTDTATLCIGLEALGKIGSASTSPKLIAAMHKFAKDAECPEVVYSDFTGHEVLICTHINLMERLLHEIAHIGDRASRPDVLKISKDPSFSPAVQALAAEIAFQMKYKPAEPIPQP